MDTVVVSTKYQVVIPREIRASLDIKPGTRCQVLRYDNRIELIPVKPMRKMRGFLRGMDTEVKREKDRV
ncbi:MAG TPA: AbrB/MazE/SpoVT family DNA-binding domain-containing protein [Syntrophales bacterium]|nr:AbrB/MazE/SpoVT family DNA-binding domain-containing protein [Syntrophales bacterium]